MNFEYDHPLQLVNEVPKEQINLMYAKTDGSNISYSNGIRGENTEMVYSNVDDIIGNKHAESSYGEL